MASQTPDLTALLGSRICHDLISPLGAIGNGLELLMMSGAAAGPEIALIAESVTNANARIRFFRIAYGTASAGQSVSVAEIRAILDDITRGGRLRIDWQIVGDAPRPDVKMAFLALQCLETAMPYGGKVTVSTDADGCRLTGEAEKLKIDDGPWGLLQDGKWPDELAAAKVQFALLPAELARHGRTLKTDLSVNRISLRF